MHAAPLPAPSPAPSPATSTFKDLPRDVIELVGAHLGLKGTWRSVDEVVRDQAALAMTARCTEVLAEVLASDMCSEIGDLGLRGACISYAPIAKPVIPCMLDGILETAHADSPMVDIRSAAKTCGVAAAKTKAETWRRICDAVAHRARVVQARTDHIRAFEAGPSNSPVLRNPVPHALRARVLEPQKMSAKGARDRFVLTERDLRGAPCEMRVNPYCRSAAPMRLYRVRDLRNLAESKHGDIATIDTKRARRQERGAMVAGAMERARGERLSKLFRALHERGCEFRADSQLCAHYLATGRGDVEEIANTMAEMRFCFDHTEYDEMLTSSIQDMRDAGERYDAREESHFARHRAIMEFKLRGQNLHLLPAHLADP